MPSCTCPRIQTWVFHVQLGPNNFNPAHVVNSFMVEAGLRGTLTLCTTNGLSALKSRTYTLKLAVGALVSAIKA